MLVNREGAEISARKFNPCGGHFDGDFIQGLWPNLPNRQFFANISKNKIMTRIFES